ncbi:unannotated protein [freshwater metagenome]|uniref:Unannotated protein n=1 Tax=freshwater metagenome TaxID=449393 RepID=A0A6J7KTV8_9ZZZZ|nr:hypothetical protein [Actinomycetota bacterium]
MLPAIYLKVPKTRANLVQGLGGSFTDALGSSRGISNAIDRELLLDLRSLADVVVTDGETARREGYRIPKACDLAVITRAGYVPAAGVSKRNYVELRMSPPQAIRELIESGYQRILIECGPSLIAEMISVGLIDQLCLTNTSHSKADLPALGIGTARLDWSQQQSDTTFSVWSEIQAS